MLSIRNASPSLPKLQNDTNLAVTGLLQLRENLEKGTFLKNQGKPGKLRDFSDNFYNLRENSGNFILPNISDEIGGVLRINVIKINKWPINK